ncbi:MAG: AsmA family protein [Hyphomicrobium sp.]
MNNALAYLGGFLALVLAALFAAPAMIDWNGYRGVFEEEASKLLGRDVRVGGGVNVRLLPTPYVKFEKVRLADVSGQTGEPFIRVENFTMRLSGPALLRGVLEATEIELNKPVLSLALDSAGGGNWSSIALQPGALPFVPRDVTLRSVKLSDGVVSIYAPDAALATRVEAINGELSADAIKGPYRFKGTTMWAGAVREIRFATTEMSGDGGFRIKAVTTAPTTGNSFTLDAAVEAFSTKPKLSGELTGLLPLPGAQVKVFAKPGSISPAETQPTMALKANIVADSGGASLSDMTLSLENAAEPQIIAGTAKAIWTGAPRLDVAMTSKWLDLDKLAGAGQESAPFHGIKQLVLGVVGAVAGDGAAGAKIDVEQVKIGGETAGGLKIDAERIDGAVRLKELRAGLPGGSRLGLFGDIKSNESSGFSFEGEGFISGTSLGRLKSWAERSGAAIDVGQDGVFSAEGKVRIGGERFELTHAAAEVGGRPMSGEIKISGEGRRRAEITVESASLDSGDLFPQTTQALDAAIRRAVGIAAAPAGATAPAGKDSEPGMDIVLRVLTGEMKHGAETYRDVDATVALENGGVRVPSAKFTTAGGLTVAVEGRVDSKDGAPLGEIAFDAAGASQAAMRDLVRVLGVEALVDVGRAEAIGSTKLAGLVKLGARSPKSASVSVDGLLAGSRIAAHGVFDGGLSEWRRQPSEVRASIEAPSIADLATVLGRAPRSPSPSAPVSRPVRLAITTVGALTESAAARFELTADGLALSYDAGLNWPEAQPFEIDGRLDLAARDVGDLLTIAGIGHATGLTGTGANGAIDVQRKDGAWSLTSDKFSVGASTTKGRLTIADGSNGAAAIAGEVDVDLVTTEGLLAPFVEATAIAAAAPDAGATPAVEDAPRPAAWPEGRFDFTVLGHVNGDVALAFSRLSISDGMQLNSGRMTLSMAPGKLALKEISGAAAAGKVSGDVIMESSQSGVSGDAKFTFESIELSALGASGRGRAGISVSLSGRALSPAALIASSSGDGHIKLDAAQVAGPTNAAAQGVVESVLQGKTENEVEAVTAALKAALTTSVVDLGTRAIDFKISNGVASIAPIAIEDDAGATTAAASLDIGAWAVTSLWKIAPRIVRALDGGAAEPQKSPLPPLSVAFNGRVGELSALDVAIEATALQRDLTVRQMERSVEDLERLRRMDEERARVERERQKALEEKRAQDAAASRSSVQNPPPASPAGPESGSPDSSAPAPQSNAPAVPAGQPPATTAGGQPAANTTLPAATDGANASGTEAPPVNGPAGASISVAPTDVNAQRPISRPRPTRQAAPRRSPNDEVMRSLGAIP